MNQWPAEIGELMASFQPLEYPAGQRDLVGRFWLLGSALANTAPDLPATAPTLRGLIALMQLFLQAQVAAQALASIGYEDRPDDPKL